MLIIRHLCLLCQEWMVWKMGKECGIIPQKVGELPKYNKLRYQVTAIFTDTTKNYGSRTNGKIKKY